MSDLDKLMKKLKTEEPKKEEPKPEIDDDEDEDDDVSEENDSKVSEKPTPASEDNQSEEHSIEAEVGILQNNGIFRRELLLIKKEQVDVLKIMAQTLLDIKKKLIGDDDGKKN